MKKILFSCLLLGALTTLQKNAQAQKWVEVWTDEFKRTSLGPDWNIETGIRGKELAYYRAENVTVDGENLVITAKQESFGGKNYTSGRINTNRIRRWKYGKMEARIKLPAFTGSWPAFWLLGHNFDSLPDLYAGEIDIMEQRNTENIINGSAHWIDQNGQHSNSPGPGHFNSTTSKTVTDYHIYRIEWTPTYIRYWVDDFKFAELNITNGLDGKSELHNHMFMILNMAVGGWFPGFTIDNSSLPDTMLVDWVKVYRDEYLGDGRIEAENYNAKSNGVRTEPTTDAGGGSNLGWIGTGDWMQYYNVIFPTDGKYQVEYRVAGLYGGRLSLDRGVPNSVLGQLDVPATGGWQTWWTIKHTVTVTAGTHTLGIYAQAGGWNLNWIRITPVALATARMETTPAAVMKPGGEEQAAKAFTIYPNPVKQQLNITSAEPLTGGLIRIFDISGKQVITATPASNQIDVSALAPGVYTLVFTKNKTKITKEFVK